MTDAKSIPSELLDQLRRLSHPACLIDVPAALVVWANDGARRALELADPVPESAGQHHGSWRLDASSPALDQLATLQQATGPVDAAGSGGRTQILAFRTATGVKRFLCRCRMLTEIRLGLVLITAAAQVIDDDRPPAIVSSDLEEHLPPVQNHKDKVTAHATGQSSWLAHSRRRHDTPRRRQRQRQRQVIAVAEEAGRIAGEARPRQKTGTPQDMATLQEIARRIREDRSHDRLRDSSEFGSESQNDFVAASSPLRAANASSDMTAAAAAAMSPPDDAIPASKRPMIVIATQDDEMIAGTERRPRDTAMNGAPAPSGNAEALRAAAGPLAQLAHELRTPISAIHTAAAIMAQERFGSIANPRYKSYAQDIEQSAAHALEVITGMLNPETLRTGRPHLEFTQVDLDALVKDTLGAMAPLAEKANVELSGKLAEALPHVIADARAVKQMLLNLLTNAVKFTGPGGRITVTTDFELDGPVRVEVRDSGPGMSQQQIAGIMNGLGEAAEPQQRRKGGSGSATGLGQGLGLGLPLTLSLARANNAELRLISGEGEGRDDAGLSATIIFPKNRTLAAW